MIRGGKIYWGGFFYESSEGDIVVRYSSWTQVNEIISRGVQLISLGDIICKPMLRASNFEGSLKLNGSALCESHTELLTF